MTDYDEGVAAGRLVGSGFAEDDAIDGTGTDLSDWDLAGYLEDNLEDHDPDEPSTAWRAGWFEGFVAGYKGYQRPAS